MVNVKLIIFDMDGTLYNLDDVVQMNYNMQVDFYSHQMRLSKEEVIQIFLENNIYPTITEKSKSATEFFVRSGIESDKWNSYRENHFDVSMINREYAASESIIKSFASIAPIILLSSNSMRNMSKILTHIGLRQELFEDIICSDHKHSDGTFNKLDEMRRIIEKYNVEPANVLSIGDRYKTDIEPLLSLGGLGVLANGPQDLCKIFEALQNKSLDGIRAFGLSRD